MSLLINMNLKGIASAIPAAGNGGRMYFATDTSVIYRDNGTSWDAVNTGSGSSIANIQITLPTSAIAANSTSGNFTASMTGLATTSTFTTAFATDPTSVTGWGTNGGLVLAMWPTADTLNWCVINQTGSSITPGAMTLNVGAK